MKNRNNPTHAAAPKGSWLSLQKIRQTFVLPLVLLGGAVSAYAVQAATPVFNVPAGSYTRPQTVTMTSSTPGASIRYTIDGTNPTSTTGTVYAGPVTVPKTRNLRAVAYKSGYTTSAVNSGNYTIGFFVDPATGNNANSGTASSPWKTLEEVFPQSGTAKTFIDDDVIFLKNGYHGAPKITGTHTADVTISVANGHVATLKSLDFDTASHYKLKGTVDFANPSAATLKISSTNQPGGAYDNGALVVIPSNSSYITLEACSISAMAVTTNVSAWTNTNWTDRVGSGIITDAPNCTFRDNWLQYVKLGIQNTGDNTLVSENMIHYFLNDGIRALGNYCTYEYNTIKNVLEIDTLHDDGIQFYTTGAGGVGTGTLTGVVVRGNLITDFEDASLPLRGNLQGMMGSDGFFDDFVIENNVVLNDHWHGITLIGAHDCRIVNNTVAKNPVGDSGMTPWIQILHHKTLGNSTGNFIRNNLTSDIHNIDGNGVPHNTSTIDHNVVSTAYTSHFVNYAAFDIHLKSTSSAVGFGTTTLAPTIDIELDPRTGTIDAGADER